jgi:ferric-dicitrate binding protein FerR (iron transport regulator)
MNNEISPELLKKYIKGETTPEENVQVDQWYLSLQDGPDDVSLLDPLEHNFVQNKLFDRISSKIQSSLQDTPSRKQRSNSFFLTIPLKLAAAITAIAVIGIWAILFINQKGLPSLQHQPIILLENGMKKMVNNTESVRRVMMEDGTVITLKPNSSIEYPEAFASDVRRISLKGEAFFDVSKDKNRPFIISTSQLRVKVLGTSFNVVAYEGAEEASVAVKTGKVSVVKSNPVIEREREIEEVILTPNQEVVYNTMENLFSKKLVAEPEIILPKPTLFETQYDGEPVVKILSVLEENYGIDIQYDEEILSNCILTTSMAEEGLYERIQIICKAIGAEYEINNANIIIKSTGCK